METTQVTRLSMEAMGKGGLAGVAPTRGERARRRELKPNRRLARGA